MKKLLLIPILLLSTLSPAQTYPSYNVQLVSHLTPNMGDVGADGRRYSGCWGWYQASKNKEYAICGTSNGTYFVDITSPSTPTVSKFLASSQGCTYREIKTNKNYAYIVSDDVQSNGMQIVDLQYLPDSLPPAITSFTFDRAHAIWIDGDHLYASSVSYTNGYTAMSVYSIANPTVPVLLRKLNQDFPFIDVVHDAYSRNDTVYASCSGKGLYIFFFDKTVNQFKQLGSYASYPKAGYQHSSFLSPDGKKLVMCDEIPWGCPIQVADVSNPSNIQTIRQFLPHTQTTPHNPFVKNNHALVSCYEDGLYIYDISNAAYPSMVGYFDTYPQGGANNSTYGSINYRGNWGNYPYLPSGLIVANDMQNGLFILDATAAFTTAIQNPLDLSEKNNLPSLEIYPNPAREQLHIDLNQSFDFIITDALGRTVLLGHKQAKADQTIDIHALTSGCYFLTVRSQDQSRDYKFTVQ